MYTCIYNVNKNNNKNDDDSDNNVIMVKGWR